MRNLRSMPSRTIRTAVAAAAVVLALPGAASATVVSATSIASSVATRTVSAACPTGERLTGVGGDVTGGLGRVALTGLTPTANLSGASATAAESETGTTSNWTLRVYAICHPDSWGLHVVPGVSAWNSVNKSAMAFCPSGERVFGVAGAVVAGAGQVVLDDLTPNAPLTGVTVTGAEDETGHASDWKVRAFAICGKPGGKQLLERVSATSATDSLNKGAVTPPCPDAPGGGFSELVGVGADLTNASGQAVLDMIAPISDTRTWVQAYEDANGAPFAWTVRAYGVCLQHALA